MRGLQKILSSCATLPALHRMLPSTVLQGIKPESPGVERQVLRVASALGSSPQSLLWGPYTTGPWTLPASLQLLCGSLSPWPNRACHHRMSRGARGRRVQVVVVVVPHPEKAGSCCCHRHGRGGHGWEGGRKREKRGSSYSQWEPCTDAPYTVGRRKFWLIIESMHNT